MKRLFRNSLFLALSASAMLFYSCGEDGEDVTTTPPSLSVSIYVNGSAATSAVPGDSISFTAAGTAEGEVNRLVGKLDGSTFLDLDRNELGLSDGDTQLDFDGYIDGGVPNAAAGTTWMFEFILVDDLGVTDTAMATLTIGSATAKVQTAVLLYAPTGDKASDTFYSIADNMVYSSNDVTGTATSISPSIDLGYYYGNSDLASLASIDSYSKLTTVAFSDQVAAWNTKNDTKIIETTLTSEAYMALSTVSDVETAFDAVDFTAEDGITSNLTVGDILAFQTVGGLEGFIYVAEIQGTFNSTDYIKLEFILAAAE